MDDLSGVDVALKFLDVVFDVFGLVGDREVEGVVTKAETEGV